MPENASRAQTRFISQAMRLRDARIQHPRILSADLLDRARTIGDGNPNVEIGALRDTVKEVCRAYGRLLTAHLDLIDSEADQPSDEAITAMARCSAAEDFRMGVTELARQYKGFDEDRPAILDMLNAPPVEGPDIHDSRDYEPITPMDGTFADDLLDVSRGTPVRDDMPPTISIYERFARRLMRCEGGSVNGIPG